MPGSAKSQSSQRRRREIASHTYRNFPKPIQVTMQGAIAQVPERLDSQLRAASVVRRGDRLLGEQSRKYETQMAGCEWEHSHSMTRDGNVQIGDGGGGRFGGRSVDAELGFWSVGPCGHCV